MPAQYTRPVAQTTRSSNLRLLLILGVLALLLIVAWGIYQRLADASALKDATEAAAIPTVNVGPIAHGPTDQEIVLPGTVQANYETAIYARTSGYLKRWLVDIGARVTAGQLLAEIDTPEVDAQYRQAQADLATAQAASSLAQSTAKRWQALRKTDSVSQQETDEKQSDAAAKAAATASSEANLARLKQLEDFKRVVAPFDGVITARTTDIGALITAGTGGPQALFRIADNSKLRIYVQVPQNYTGQIKPDMIVDLQFAEHPGQKFPAKLVRTASALDPSARSLLVELQADNANGVLLPGGYTETHFKLATAVDTVRVPVSALLFRSDGLHVAILGPNDRAALKTVTIGRDFGTEVEIVSGLAAGDQLIINPPDSLLDQEQVRAVPLTDAAPQTAKKPA